MAVTGHEEGFRRLYAQEAETRLGRMTEHLLQLEAGGFDAAAVDTLFREAHTLKGGAGVVGFSDVAGVTHALEGVLERMREGAVALGSDLVDTLLDATDGLRELIAVSLDGGEAVGRADMLITALRRAAGVQAGTEEPAGSGAALPERTVASPPYEPPDVGPTRTASSGDGAVQAGDGAGQARDTIRVGVERLDDLVRLVAEAASAQLRFGRALSERLGIDPQVFDEFRQLSTVLADLQNKAMRARMVPVSGITAPLHRAVRDAARALGREVVWDVRGADTELDRGVLEQLADPLLHLLRTAVAHGLEPPTERLAAGKPAAGSVRVSAMQLGSEVVFVVSDDGRGIDAEAVRRRAADQGVDVSGVDDAEALSLVFTSGLSTAPEVTDLAGRGVGLDVVRATLERVRGRVEVSSQRGVGTEFRLVVPITLAVLRCLFVAAGGQRFALPLQTVVTALPPPGGSPPGGEGGGRPVVWLGQRPVPVSGLADTLSEGNARWSGDGPVVVVGGTARLHGFRVDALLGQRDVVVKGLGPLLPHLEVVAGASVEPDGSVVLVLDPPGLIARARRPRPARAVPARAAPGPREGDGAPTSRRPRQRARILVVDDSLAVREMQRSILQRAGYEVGTAANGDEAMADLVEAGADLVLTDVEMPRLDGFALIEQIRAQPALAGLPVVILTSHGRAEDRRRGLLAGANAYVVKSVFDAAALLSIVDGLLERAP